MNQKDNKIEESFNPNKQKPPTPLLTKSLYILVALSIVLFILLAVAKYFVLHDYNP